MNGNGKIQVLVIEDSAVARQLLEHILVSDPGVGLLGAVASGEEALGLLERSRPDVILMDIHLPGMDGYETTRRIMETRPVPIVVCSASVNVADVADTFRAVEAGAVALVAKPVWPSHPDYECMARNVVRTVRAMAEVKLVRRWPRGREPREARPPCVSAPPLSAQPGLELVAIGASTGGPPALQSILGGLPKDFPVPLLAVQHIAAGFLPGLADWLRQSTGFPVHIAAHGERMLPGRAYLAPDGYHTGASGGGRIVLSRGAPENGLRPAVSYLFRTVAAAYGSRAAGVLLSGMGRDGSDELKLLKDAGCLTIAQDAESSVVHGMPGEAIRLGGATQVLAPEQIASALVALTMRRSSVALPASVDASREDAE